MAYWNNDHLENLLFSSRCVWLTLSCEAMQIENTKYINLGWTPEEPNPISVT